MSSIINNARISKELIKRGLLPDNCKVVEVRIEPHGALIMRYEVFVRPDQLDRFADALKASAQEALADDERNRLARAQGPAQ